MIQIERLHALIERFHDTAVLVIGDVMIDEYIWGKVSRISPEAPVPILDMVSESQRLGGSANVLNNIHSLGGKPHLCSVIGNDTTGKRLKESLQGIGVNTDTLIVDSTRPTTRKTRLIAHHQQVARLDRESREDIRWEDTQHIIEMTTRMLPEIDGIIIEDYGKGVVTGELVREVVALATQQDKIVAVDPKTSHFDRYSGVSVITPNHHEAGASLHITLDNHERLLLAGKQLLEKLQSDYVLITRGEEGMSLFEQQSRMVTHVPTMAQEVYDVTGAGDTVIAALTLGLASGGNPADAVLLSNAAAGVVVGKVGTATSNLEELQTVLQKMNARDLHIRRETFE
ncbi:MAG: D-glycero-beta-D-manno-heptose-7-phosphate kinase [bacterium]|nr:D-glycero-beta-D-manno-heptose-7-phosphate kinase [bacterium]